MIGYMAKKNSDRHRSKAIGVRPPTIVREQIQAEADRERRSLAQMALILIEEALTARQNKRKADD